MASKQKLIFVGSVIVIAVLACQNNINPIPSPKVEPTKRLETDPTYEALNRRISTGEALISTVFPRETNTVVPTLPPGFLEDANTACAVHQTDHALSCLNKNGWQVYDSDVPTLITPCPDGRTYLKVGNQLYLYKNQTFIEVSKPAPYIEVPYVYALACGRGSEFWALAPDDELMHFDGTAWTDFRGGNLGLLSGIFGVNREIAVAPNGNLWMTNDDSIVTFDGTDWQIFKKDKGLEEAIYPRGLVLDANGNVWVLSGGSGYSFLGSNPNPSDLANIPKGLPYKLLKYDGTHWTTIAVPAGFDPDFIRLDHANKIWVIGTGNPIDSTLTAFYTLFYTFDTQANSWALQAKEARFSKRKINDVQFDRQDRLWVATDYGLDIYDGSAWITYRMDIANLYANSADKIITLGDGPQLPAPLSEASGSVSGKIVDPKSTKSYAGLHAEVCLNPEMFLIPGEIPCANQAYHALTTMDADGNFLFTDIPAGRYYLAIQRSSDTWGMMVSPSSPQGTGLEFEVYSGEEAQLGQITYSPNEK